MPCHGSCQSSLATAAPSAASVVVAELSDENGVVLDLVDEPMLVIDAARPITPKGMSQRLRLAGAAVRLSLYLSEEMVDPADQLTVGLLPVQVVLPSPLGEGELQSARSRSAPPPRSSSAIASIRRLAFLGLRRR